jgi:hypothetical protein
LHAKSTKLLIYFHEISNKKEEAKTREKITLTAFKIEEIERERVETKDNTNNCSFLF